MSSTVLVCGGRDFYDLGLMKEVLEYWRPESILYTPLKDCGRLTIIAGEACGADWLAKALAYYWDLDYRGFPADWKTHKYAAGPLRNKQMLDEGKPDLVVAFKGGNGTADMVRQAKKAGVPVIEVQ